MTMTLVLLLVYWLHIQCVFAALTNLHTALTIDIKKSELALFFEIITRLWKCQFSKIFKSENNSSTWRRIQANFGTKIMFKLKKILCEFYVWSEQK